MSKEALTPERIAAAALALIDAAGLEAFSTRKLGAALGVEAMSLYHHFPSKGHLLDAVVDSILAQVVVPDEPADDPIARFRKATLSYRSVARAHPGAFLLIVARRFHTPCSLALMEKLLALFQEAGLAPDRAARYFRMVGYFLNGALLSELTALGPRPESGAPATVRSGGYLGAGYLDATFDEGLEALLSLVRREIDAAR